MDARAHTPERSAAPPAGPDSGLLAAWLVLSRAPAAARRDALQAWFAGRAPAPPGRLPAWVDDCLRWQAASPAHHCLPISDPRYPPLLRNIPAAPLVLFLRGRPQALRMEGVAVVGARRATPGGLETARALGHDLAAGGLCVVSGLALGVDAAAHQGALTAAGATIAVLGSGPDRVYPRRHAALAEGILEHGALVSEFIPGTPPAPANFPRRNRIISGLCRATVVVEAGLRSGSLVTARLAAEQGREVGAVPGAVQNPMASGTNQLLHDGAALIRDAADVLTLLPELVPAPVAPAGGLRAAAAGPPGEAGVVWAALESHPVSVDRLQARTGWDVPRLAAVLGELEVGGLVQRVAGGYTRTCFDHPEALVSRASCEQEQ